VRILLLAVGKAKTGPVRALFEDYARRLRPPLELIEVEERRRLGAAEMKRREAELLRAQLITSSSLVTRIPPPAVGCTSPGKDLLSSFIGGFTSISVLPFYVHIKNP